MLLIEPDGARLFTDFRYMEKARELGIQAVAVPRDIYSKLGEHVGGRIEFQAESLTYAHYAALEAGGFELVPRQELMTRIRAVKEDAELEAISRAAAITNECFERSPSSPSSAGLRRSSPGGSSR